MYKLISHNFRNFVKLHGEEGDWFFHLWFCSLVLVVYWHCASRCNFSSQTCLSFICCIFLFAAVWTFFVWIDSSCVHIKTQILNHFFSYFEDIPPWKSKVIWMYFSFRWVKYCVVFLSLAQSNWVFNPSCFLRFWFPSKWSFNVIFNLIR